MELKTQLSTKLIMVIILKNILKQHICKIKTQLNDKTLWMSQIHSNLTSLSLTLISENINQFSSGSACSLNAFLTFILLGQYTFPFWIQLLGVTASISSLFSIHTDLDQDKFIQYFKFEIVKSTNELSLRNCH